MQHDLRNTDTYSTFPIEQTAKGFKKYNRKNKFSIFWRKLGTTFLWQQGGEAVLQWDTEKPAQCRKILTNAATLQVENRIWQKRLWIELKDKDNAQLEKTCFSDIWPQKHCSDHTHTHSHRECIEVSRRIQRSRDENAMCQRRDSKDQGIQGRTVSGNLTLQQGNVISHPRDCQEVRLWRWANRNLHAADEGAKGSFCLEDQLAVFHQWNWRWKITRPQTTLWRWQWGGPEHQHHPRKARAPLACQMCRILDSSRKCWWREKQTTEETVWTTCIKFHTRKRLYFLYGQACSVLNVDGRHTHWLQNSWGTWGEAGRLDKGRKTHASVDSVMFYSLKNKLWSKCVIELPGIKSNW